MKYFLISAFLIVCILSAPINQTEGVQNFHKLKKLVRAAMNMTGLSTHEKMGPIQDYLDKTGKGIMKALNDGSLQGERLKRK